MCPGFDGELVLFQQLFAREITCHENLWMGLNLNVNMGAGI